MMQHKEIRALVISFALAVAMVCTMLPATAFAAENVLGSGASAAGVLVKGTATTDISNYNSDDVAAVNKLISENGLNAAPNQPADWQTAGLVNWDGSTHKRINRLNLKGQNLTGALDLSNILGHLTTLDCSNNKLTALNLSGITILQWVDCSNNLLSSLNVSGCNIQRCPELQQ